ncbi:MAG: hypothetical protein COB30_012425 [Ectothiorhodospiraceae bacterium]|nr:hypothetical protein [Ectothiorhodospiraceae bacterium]
MILAVVVRAGFKPAPMGYFQTLVVADGLGAIETLPLVDFTVSLMVVGVSKVDIHSNYYGYVLLQKNGCHASSSTAVSAITFRYYTPLFQQVSSTLLTYQK